MKKDKSKQIQKFGKKRHTGCLFEPRLWVVEGKNFRVKAISESLQCDRWYLTSTTETFSKNQSITATVTWCHIGNIKAENGVKKSVVENLAAVLRP